MMISFIVIGKNEGWRLSKCLNSVLKCIQEHSLENFEIIYVDSNSTDESRSIAKKFHQVKVLNLVKDCNAAIARNTGVRFAEGDVYFFIDGDMEIQSNFLSLVYDPDHGLSRDFISGNWMNYNYDENDNLINKEIFLKLDKDITQSTTGGLFLIKASIWRKMGGMRNVFKKSQDIDLGLRLAKNGTLLLRKKEIAAFHHTIAYRDRNRIWKELLNGKHLYGRSLLYRMHILNPNMYKRLVRNDYSLLVLILVLMIWAITGIEYVLLLYPLIVIFRSKLNFKITTYFLVRDVMVMLGFFLFYPKKNFDIEIVEE